MTEITFYDHMAAGDIKVEVFHDLRRRGIQLIAHGGVVLADAWLDEGECAVTAGQALKDLLCLRQESP